MSVLIMKNLIVSIIIIWMEIVMFRGIRKIWLEKEHLRSIDLKGTIESLDYIEKEPLKPAFSPSLFLFLFPFLLFLFFK